MLSETSRAKYSINYIGLSCHYSSNLYHYSPILGLVAWLPERLGFVPILSC
jgi:hypothetical protein